MEKVSHVIEVILFRSRFLLAPLYLGLVGALLLLTYRFIIEFIHIFEKVGEASAQTFTLDLLALLDLRIVDHSPANLPPELTAPADPGRV